jgi:hypothetical protein
MTPAAGPESIDSTGIDSTRLAGRVPPFEVMMDRGAEMADEVSRVCNSLRYRRMRGATKALRAVVEKRSYSRYSGKTSDEVVMTASGSRRPRISAARRSCSALA